MKLDRLIQIKTNNLKPVKGRVLLSEPFMGDYFFGRSVVLLADHNDEGSFGVIVNKRVSNRLGDYIKDFPVSDMPLYLGGPVESNRMFFIHTFGEVIDQSVPIFRGLYWGGNIEDVKELAASNLLNEDNIRFFVGYSGWGAKQLHSELKRNSWVVTHINADQIFKTQPDELWKKLTLQLGTNYQLWKTFPEDPAMN
jgi:putative transcriptional regulator